MTTQDILSAAINDATRFQVWLAFTMCWEPRVRNSVIVSENDHDGEGITFAGLTVKSDQLPVDPSGEVIATPEWIVQAYLNGYWNPSQALSLPYPVGEVVANFALNCGLSEGARFLQQAINSLGGSVQVDGECGSHTLSAAFALPDSKDLARAICAHAMDHYHAVVAAHPHLSDDLEGWTNRTDDLLQTFCS